ncbi:MAG: cell division protein FtsZ [Cytophagales bacterium]|nr:cell division protein FtsZ [Cytophagales bacterium]
MSKLCAVVFKDVIMDYNFDIPKREDGNKPIIKVVGVGGGGGNAVSHMYNEGINNVEFVICNTDKQALEESPVPTKIRLGLKTTEGLGAGADPSVGADSALEAQEDVRNLFVEDGTKMVFVTAGMGGGTGTGAAPVIAKIAKDLDILTVGIVTAPFHFEGDKKMVAAQRGIDEMKAVCDTVIIVSNEKVKEIYGNLPTREAFMKADDVLTTAAKSTAELITVHSRVNVDFRDVKTVMKNAGGAVMGSFWAEGKNRARMAVEGALTSPLLNNMDIRGSKRVLLSMAYSPSEELMMNELEEITDYVKNLTGNGADVIFGEGPDERLESGLTVTVVATGFKQKDFLDSVEGGEDVRRIQAEKKEQEGFVEGAVPVRRRTNIDTRDKQEFAIEPSSRRRTIEVDEEVTNNTERLSDKTDSEFPIVEKSRVSKERASYIKERLGRYRKKNQIEKRERLEAREEIRRTNEEEVIVRREERVVNNTFSTTPSIDDELSQVPAYQRNGVKLKTSASRGVSKFSVRKDELGDNSYLHDNPD